MVGAGYGMVGLGYFRGRVRYALGPRSTAYGRVESGRCRVW